MKNTLTIVTVFVFCTVLLSHECRAQLNLNDHCLEENEYALYQKINEWRALHGKNELPLSRSLSYVARLHVTDLYHNRPDTSICNTSSWSDKGSWSPCCYQAYVDSRECMWKKPKELTAYTYRGYEMVWFGEGLSNPDSIMAVIRQSELASDFILTINEFEDKSWRTMGVAYYEGYASIWFGQRTDPAKKIAVCSTTTTSTVIASTGRYYLIFGSFTNYEDAEKASLEHKNAGFKDAKVISSEDKFRVSLNDFSSMKSAIDAKDALPFAYRKAWIFKQ